MPGLRSDALPMADRQPRDGLRSVGTITSCLLALSLGVTVAWDARAAVLVTAALIVPVLAWSDPRIALGLLCITLGLNVDVIRHPVHVSLPQLASIALVAAILLRAHRSARLRPGRLWTMAGLCILIAGLPSMLRVTDLPAATSTLVQLAAVAVTLAVIVSAACNDWLRVDHVFALLVVGGLVSLAPAVAQVALDIGPPTYRIGGLMRAYSTYGQPNTYGLYLAGVLPLSIALTLRTRNAGWALAVCALILGLVLTGSRGAWVAGASGVLVYWAITARMRAGTVLAGAAVLALGVTLLDFTPEAFLAGRLDLTDWSAQQRLLLLLSAWDGIASNPVLGHGPGSFAAMLPELARNGLTDDAVMPHNFVLQIWFELGLLAALSLLLLIGAYYVTAVRAYMGNRDTRLAALIAAVTAMLAGAMFGTLLIRGIQETFILLIALTAATALRCRPAPSGSDSLLVGPPDGP